MPKPKATVTQTFVLKRGDGAKIFNGFNPASDRLLLDFGSYSDSFGSYGTRTGAASIMPPDALTDGLTWNNFNNTATFTLHDTAGGVVLSVAGTNDSATLAGLTLAQLKPSSLYGG